MSDATGPISFTERAIEVLVAADRAARRFDPNARLRVARDRDGVTFVFADGPDDGDREIDAGGVSVLVAPGLEGVVDVAEHDRLVLRES